VSRTFGQRLVFLATFVIAGTLASLIVVVALFVFASYVGTLRAAEAETLDEIRTFVADHGETADARQLAVASRFFAPGVVVIALDATRRVEVREAPALPDARRLTDIQIDVRPRNDVTLETPHGVFGRLTLALGTFFGLGPQREQFGPVLVIVRSNDTRLVATVRRFLPAFVVAELLAILLGFTIARLLARKALEPLVDVTRALERFAAGDLTPQPIAADSKHQLGALALAYNGAIEQMSLAFAERERAQARMRQFITDAAHQLRTPLTVIRGFIAILRKGELRGPEDRERILATMNRQSMLMASLVDKLLLLERWDRAGDAPVHEPIDVSQLVEDVVAPLAEARSERDVHLEIEPNAAAPIDPIDLTHALTNVVDNALAYTRGRVTVRVALEQRGRVRVEIADEGPGMSADEVAHAFERFYRGNRRDVDGSGLGLAIARLAVERAGGSLTLESSLEVGSRFTILLPASDVFHPKSAGDGTKVPAAR
jgi:two-component system OmpR family sensor kinase